MEKLNSPTTLFCFIPKDKSINKIILSRPKCGSRFLEECGMFDRIDITTSDLNKLKKADKIYWIIRKPLKHFASAFITELQSRFANSSSYNKNTKINVQSNNNKLVYKLLNELLTTIATEPLFETKNDVQFTHYCPTYEFILNTIKTEYKIFYKTSFIELSDLSNLLIQSFNIKHPYHSETYSFDKEDIGNVDVNTKNIISILNEPEFLDKWSIVKKSIDIDEVFYTQISKFDFSQFLLEKVNDLHNKLDMQIVANNKTYIEQIDKLNRIVKNT
jgi:hypothetical protein